MSKDIAKAVRDYQKAYNEIMRRWDRYITKKKVRLFYDQLKELSE